MVFSFPVVVTFFPDRAEVVRKIDATLPAEPVNAQVVAGEFAATYEPGETRSSNFGYAVSYPDGEAVPGF